VNRPSHTRRASLCALASSRYSRVDRLLLTFRVFRYTVPIGTISQPMHIYAPPPLIIQQQASYSRQLVSPAPACAASSAGGGCPVCAQGAPRGCVARRITRSGGGASERPAPLYALCRQWAREPEAGDAGEAGQGTVGTARRPIAFRQAATQDDSFEVCGGCSLRAISRRLTSRCSL
jgi:hypothetical protein